MEGWPKKRGMQYRVYFRNMLWEVVAFIRGFYILFKQRYHAFINTARIGFGSCLTFSVV